MRVRDHLLLAGSCGALVGVAEGIVVGQGGRPAAVLVCAGLLGSAGLLLGLLQAAAWSAGRWWWRRSRARAWLAPRLDPEPAASREPVRALHVGIVAGACGVASMLSALRLVLVRLEAVADPELRHLMILVAVVGLGALALWVSLAVAGLVRPAIRWLDDRFGLPRPRRPATRFILLVALPAVALGYYALTRHGGRLGALRLVIYLGMFPALEGLVLDLWRWAAGLGPLRRLRAPLWLAPAMALVLVASPFAAFALRPNAAKAAQHATLSGPALRLVQSLSDFDGDGASAWLGGGDCAPGDPAIGPFVLDVPNNGVDEDCSGADADADDATLRPAKWRSEETSKELAYERRRYNVVWIVVDAIRSDHCQLHGYDKPTTPYLAHLGKSSWVFDRAYSQSSATMLSIPSMLSGLRPSSITWKMASGKLQLGADHVTLAERLKQEGYRTGAVTGKYSIRKLHGMFQGFDDVIDTWLDEHRFPWFGRNAAVASSLAIQWLERDPELTKKGADPFFLMVYMADPHDPYSPHEEAFPSFGKGERARYDGEIAFTDRYVGMFLDYLRYRRPLFEDTIIVFTSDHGEEFGEHGGKIHAYTCYEECVHVPLLVRIPGAVAKRVAQPVALVDIAPTILDALGIDAGAMTLDGASLPLSATGALPERPRFCSVLSQKAKQGKFFRRAVRYRGQTLISNIVAGTYELYDVTKDPGEQDDLLRAPDAAPPAELRALLDASVQGNLLQMRMVK